MVVLSPARLWTRDFSLYFVGRAVALMGDAMLPVAVTLGVLGIYGPVGVGIVLAAWMAAFGGLVLFGGVLADWFTARRMMIFADVLRVGTQTVIAVTFFIGQPALWLLVTMSFLSGLGAALFQPGVNSMIPQIAADPQRANATLRVADAVARLLGPGIAGAIVLFGGPGVVYAINAGTFLVSALCLLAMRVKLTKTEATSLVSDLREGWAEFRSRTWMWSVILVWSVYGIVLFGPMWPVGAQIISEAHGGAGLRPGDHGRGPRQHRRRPGGHALPARPPAVLRRHRDVRLHGHAPRRGPRAPRPGDRHRLHPRGRGLGLLVGDVGDQRPDPGPGRGPQPRHRLRGGRLGR